MIVAWDVLLVRLPSRSTYLELTLLTKEPSTIQPKKADNGFGMPRGGPVHDPSRPAVQHELSVLALLKGNERYIFVYDDESRRELLDAIRDQAAQPNLTLSWFDAAILTERARQQALEAVADRQPTRQRG